MFISPRERKLWLLAAAVVAVIFLALIAGPILIGTISESLLVLFFATGMLLVAVTVLTLGLRVQPGGIEIGIVIATLAIMVLLAVRLTLPERSHLLEFGVLAVVVFEAVEERGKHSQGSTYPLLWTLLVCVVIGFLDEGLQYFLPDRVFDWEDVLFNCLAITTAATGMALLRLVRNRIDDKAQS